MAPCELAAQAAVWELRNVTTANFDMAMAFDAARGQVLRFGGYEGVATNQTLAWDGSTWTLRSTPPPPARYAHAMVYDTARTRVVMFGGFSGTTLLQDTWEWNGTSWSLVAASGPPPRSGHAMAYDSTRQRTVLFGGSAGLGTYGGDTWEWNGSLWQLRSSGGPAPRTNADMAFDPLRGVTTLFGGTRPGSTLFADTWDWDGTTWMQRSVVGPTARSGHAMAFDAAHGVIVLFGGIAPPATTSETWTWDGSAWTRLDGLDISGTTSHGMAYDAARGRMVVFGGCFLCPFASGATFEWDGIAQANPGRAASYGVACGAPLLFLAPRQRPILGRTASVRVTNVPPAGALLSLGLSSAQAGAVSLPLALDPWGLPGCSLLQSCDAPVEPTTPVGATTADYGFAVPSWPGLLGTQLHLQAYALSPTANAAGVVLSNGVTWTFGDA